MANAPAIPPKLRWRCRRGMREMDILCTRFVESTYAELDHAGRAALERLLEHPDQDILAWLTDPASAPDDPDEARLIVRMRTVTTELRAATPDR